jgi:uncharacterized protein YbjQ (UPF0145 family)
MNANEPPAEFEEPGVSAAEQAESLAQVERGGIPLAAERRLRELGEGGGAFTSDLSVADFALCHRLGVEPVSQVMGSSIYQVGYQSTPWPMGSFMFEMEALSQAWNEVRSLALSRLAQEAAHVGADAVIGVDLQTGAHDWAENSIEYVVIGTAVRHSRDAPTGEAGVDGEARGGPGRGEQPEPHHGGRRRHGGTRARSAGPVLTELSVADYTKLLGAGIEPLGIVAWSSVFFVTGYSSQMLGGMNFMANQELREFTQGLYSAREIVVQRLTRQATELGASGVIGVRLAHGMRQTSIGGGTYARSGLMVTFHAIGTAIHEDGATVPQAPQPIIDLTT